MRLVSFPLHFKRICCIYFLPKWNRSQSSQHYLSLGSCISCQLETRLNWDFTGGVTSWPLGPTWQCVTSERCVSLAAQFKALLSSGFAFSSRSVYCFDIAVLWKVKMGHESPSEQNIEKWKKRKNERKKKKEEKKIEKILARSVQRERMRGGVRQFLSCWLVRCPVVCRSAKVFFQQDSFFYFIFIFYCCLQMKHGCCEDWHGFGRLTTPCTFTA